MSRLPSFSSGLILILAVLSGSFATPCRGQSAIGDTIYLQDGTYATDPGHPYPGLGTNGLTGESCVSYGQDFAGFPTTYPADYSRGGIPATTLYPHDETSDEWGTTVTPSREGGDLYLSRLPSGKRSGIFQKANFNALWAPKAGGSKGLGMTQLDVSATFALPLPSVDSPFIITPNFSAWFFDPKQDGYTTKKTLYSTGVDLRWIRPIVKNKFTLDLGVSPMYSGDFHVKTSKAMRYPAHLAGIWDCNPRLKVILGVVYLDRNDDYNWLPMAGVIWTPHDDLSIELVLPRIRVAQRVRWFGSAAGDTSDWLYTALEFGGGSWGHRVSVPGGSVDGHIDYRDLRLLLGYERRTAFGMTLGLEVGYMFERKFEFDRTNYSVKPNDNVFLRLRTTF